MDHHKNFSSLANKLSNKITNLLTEQKIESLAKDIGFVKHDSVKLNGWKFLDMLLLNNFNHEKLSLNDLALQLHHRYGISTSKQGINDRFTYAAVRFFHAVLEEVLASVKIDEGNMPILDSFPQVRIKDSTAFQLPALQYPIPIYHFSPFTETVIQKKSDYVKIIQPFSVISSKRPV